MQGKENQQFDQGFIEKQWNEMSSLLDNNLPTAIATPQRIYNKSAVVLSLLLLLTTLSTVYYAYKYKTRIPATELIKEKVIYKNIYIDKYIDKPVSTTAKEAAKSEILSINSSAEIVSERIVKTEEGTQHTQAYTTSSSAYQEPTEQSDYTLAQLEAVPSILSHVKSTEATESAYDLEDNSVLVNEESQKRRAHFNLGILAATTTDFAYTGMGIISGIRLPFGKRFGFNTGLAISYLDRDHLFIPDFVRGEGETLVDPKIAQTYYEGLRNLKQVYLPLNVNYNLTEAWVINSGVNLRYTYSETINEDLPLPQARPTSRQPVKDHESLFNKTNIGLSAGLEYHLNNNFTFHIESEWGLSSVLNTSQFLTQPRYDLNIVNLRTHYKF